MATHHEDDPTAEEQSGYKLSQPKQSLAEYQQMGKSPQVQTKISTFGILCVHGYAPLRGEKVKEKHS
jgi:hypothetical protein